MCQLLSNNNHHLKKEEGRRKEKERTGEREVEIRKEGRREEEQKDLEICISKYFCGLFLSEGAGDFYFLICVFLLFQDFRRKQAFKNSGNRF